MNTQWFFFTQYSKLLTFQQHPREHELWNGNCQVRDTTQQFFIWGIYLRQGAETLSNRHLFLQKGFILLISLCQCQDTERFCVKFTQLSILYHSWGLFPQLSRATLRLQLSKPWAKLSDGDFYPVSWKILAGLFIWNCFCFLYTAGI